MFNLTVLDVLHGLNTDRLHLVNKAHGPQTSLKSIPPVYVLVLFKGLYVVLMNNPNYLI